MRGLWKIPGMFPWLTEVIVNPSPNFPGDCAGRHHRRTLQWHIRPIEGHTLGLSRSQTNRHFLDYQVRVLILAGGKWTHYPCCRTRIHDRS